MTSLSTKAAIALTGLTLGLAGSAQAQSSDRAEILQLLTNVGEAYGQCSGAALGTHFAEGATGFGAVGPLATTMDFSALSRQCERGLRFQFTFRGERIETRGNAGYAAGTVDGEITGPNGQTTPANLRYSFVLIKEGGAWKILHNHYSPSGQ